MTAPLVYLVATFGVALLAAAFDWQTGRIPNVLSLGAIAVAFPLHGFLSAPGGAVNGLESVGLGGAVCGLPCLLGFRMGWIAGGDVKLITAMGALGGIGSGLESVFLSLLFASAFVVLRLCWNGVFFRTLGNALAVAVSHAVDRDPGVAAHGELTSTLRFGPFALAGAALSLALHGGGS